MTSTGRISLKIKGTSCTWIVHYDHSFTMRCHSFSKFSILFVMFAIYFECIYSCFNKFLKLKKSGVFFFNLAE